MLHYNYGKQMFTGRAKPIRMTSFLISGVILYLHTPWSMVLLKKLTGSLLVKEFPTFYGNRKFITSSPNFIFNSFM